ncbi:hypothetical protein LCGC14_1175580 [marine sediment metagenome]|uniref:Uncharacterized protein n=1 Tax=marine sediment metagenome TaxID=412755 RepID=A0A0F9LTG8_9ZZZZ
MAALDKVAVTMTRRSWTLLHSIVCDHLVDLVDEIEGTFGDTRAPLEDALKDILQKWLPVLYVAADKTEWGGDVEENHKNVQKLAGLVIPEQHEDMAKQLVFFLTEEMEKRRGKR